MSNEITLYKNTQVTVLFLFSVSEDQDVDGRIILMYIFRKLEGVVGTGWSWLSIGKGGGYLWVRCGTFGFHKCGEFFD
jgi:hypothetical protein